MGTYRNFAEMQDPLNYFSVFTDFAYYEAADWVITTTEAGAGAATEAISASLPCGVLVVTNDDADNDSDEFQWAGKSGAALEQFSVVSGKRLRFATKLKVSDAADSDLIAGLAITDTTLIDGATDGVYFRKADGDNTLQLVAETNSTEVTADVLEMVDDTFYELEFYYDGVSDQIVAYVDGAIAGSVALSGAPTDEQLSLSFGIQNGAAAAKVLSVDYIGAWQER